MSTDTPTPQESSGTDFRIRGPIAARDGSGARYCFWRCLACGFESDRRRDVERHDCPGHH